MTGADRLREPSEEEPPALDVPRGLGLREAAVRDVHTGAASDACETHFDRAHPRRQAVGAGVAPADQQAVSQHLKVLREAGLVAVRPQGQRRLYLVRPDGLESLDAFLAELWPAGLRRLKQAVESDDA